ncbi:hypothetical protein [Tenacibaculum sp. nBUS_03]|uniref:hypothetical protein n=1 Tax=Tenacibaculum sp. nBUS_03 TaxID=3395320 RepID=UPI003EBC635E
MNKLFKGNIYTDLIWLIIGIIGSVYYYSKDKYLICGIFSFLGILYILKVISSFLKKNKKLTSHSNTE